MKWFRLSQFFGRRQPVVVNTYRKKRNNDERKKAEMTAKLQSELPFIKRRVRVKAVSRPSGLVEG